MKLSLLICGAIFCSILTICSQSGQPDDATLPSVIDDSPTALATFSDNSSIGITSNSGLFPLVAALAGQTITIQIQYPTTAAGNLVIEPLDGGSVSQNETTIDAQGNSTTQFHIGVAPGLYRILLNQNGAISTLRFWVADPQQPNSGPPALHPH